MRLLPSLIITCLLVPAACRNSVEVKTEDRSGGLTPVTITHPLIGKLSDSVTLNAVSKFMLKTSVKCDINGYMVKVNVRPGQKVSPGQELFVVRTRESSHLGNTISRIDTSLNFSGVVSVKTPVEGFITDLSCQAGDYVQESEVLATVSDLNSLVFLMELPYELKKYLPGNKTVKLTLPGGETLNGSVQSSLPTVDPVSQTQSYVVYIKGISSIPENLIASVNFRKDSNSEVIILPREAVLTNEIQSEFWIMKMAGPSTAVKVRVTLGLITADKAEIISPVLKEDDQVLLAGNYGLPDTSMVKILNGR
jgi:multidrug efflux pump subunit AcrA (membrane-fusion protein)